MVGRRVVLWLVTAGRGERRRMLETFSRVLAWHSSRAITTPTRLDAVAGSEYLDDRIRLGE